VGEAKVSMLKYKSQPPEKDPFADFDKGFKAGPYRKVEPEENPMSTFDKGYKAPPYRSLEVPPTPTTHSHAVSSPRAHSSSTPVE
jgi:hypothetical protein